MTSTEGSIFETVEVNLLLSGHGLHPFRQRNDRKSNTFSEFTKSTLRQKEVLHSESSFDSPPLLNVRVNLNRAGGHPFDGPLARFWQGPVPGHEADWTYEGDWVSDAKSAGPADYYPRFRR